MFTTQRQASDEPAGQIKGQWQPTTPTTAGNFSATAFFFGLKLHNELDVPVGLIVSAWGGTPIRAWISREAQQQVSALQPLLEKPYSDRKSHHPTVLFNGMVHPWVGYGIRGFTWYQGESNAGSVESARRYKTQLQVMVRDWRNRWDDEALPFYFVQLPEYQPGGEGWAAMRQAMLEAHQSLERTGMAVTVGTADPSKIHPINKQPVGERLARWALKQTYGKALVASGPLVQSAKRKDQVVVVRFEHAGERLTLKSAPTGTFEVAGPDGRFVPAKATVAGKTLVFASSVEKPEQVRYAWQANPKAALFNSAGLPASPFQIEVTSSGD
jgi:sialate O-acetylesterase